MIKTKLPDIMRKVRTFPSMPQVVTQLLVALENPEIDTAEIVEILKYDAGLTANILKIANSAYFAFRCKIGSVRQAVVVLGQNQLKKIVMASCMASVIDKPVPGYDLDPGQLWLHSVAVSVIAENLAASLSLQNVDNIFTAALIHDIGKLVLADFVQEDIKKIQYTVSEDVSFETAERLVLGIDHAEIGALILEEWSFPPEIVEAVHWHHTPDLKKDDSVMADIIHVADLLSLMIGLGTGQDGLHYLPSISAIKRLNIEESKLEFIASQTLQLVSDLFVTAAQN